MFITLNEGKVNTLTDGVIYTLTEENSVVDGEQRNVDAVIFSRSDLTINGTGTLNIIGNYNHAVVSKDDLVITGGTLNVSAPNGGLYGRDSVKIGGGTISVTSGTDGIRADNNTRSDRGFVYRFGGSMSFPPAPTEYQAATRNIYRRRHHAAIGTEAPAQMRLCGNDKRRYAGRVGGEFDCPVGNTSTQPNVLFMMNTPVGENAPLAIAQNGETTSIATFKSLRPASVLFFTTPELAGDTEYALYTG